MNGDVDTLADIPEEELTPCDRCGTKVAYGSKDGDRWLCRPCSLWEDDEIDVVIGASEKCECGAETHFRHSEDLEPQQLAFDVSKGVFGDADTAEEDKDVQVLEYTSAGMWVCPRCFEVFEGGDR